MTFTDTLPPSATQHATAPPSRRRSILRRIRRWTRNGILGVLTLVVLATIAGQVQQARLQRAYPARGERVDVGGHRLHVIRSGAGPSVVFESGSGGMALDWTHVQRRIAAEEATTAAYDRAGIGWSDPGPRPRDVPTLVRELRLALRGSGVSPPYVLVGHSYGGLIVRAYAYTHPGEVAGLVLIDAAHEDQFSFYPAAYADKAADMSATMPKLRGVFRAVTGSGIPALFAGSFPDPIADRLPDDIADARRAAPLFDGARGATLTDEIAALEDSFAYVRSIRRPLGDMPVVVITRDKVVGKEAGVPAGLEDEVHAAWLQMQEDFLTISTDTELIVADDSGHDIHLDRPDIVTEAVRRLLAQASR